LENFAGILLYWMRKLEVGLETSQGGILPPLEDLKEYSKKKIFFA
jgi:hypothetical protein